MVFSGAVCSCEADPPFSGNTARRRGITVTPTEGQRRALGVQVPGPGLTLLRKGAASPCRPGEQPCRLVPRPSLTRRKVALLR